MAERRPDLAREHRLHDRFRGPPRASPVRFQVSRPADRTSRGWARGVPLAECRFPGPATRRLGRLRRESERSTAPGICAPLRENLWWCVVVVVVAATPNYLRQASQNLGKYRFLKITATTGFRQSFLSPVSQIYLPPPYPPAPPTCATATRTPLLPLTHAHTCTPHTRMLARIFARFCFHVLAFCPACVLCWTHVDVGSPPRLFNIPPQRGYRRGCSPLRTVHVQAHHISAGSAPPPRQL